MMRFAQTLTPIAVSVLLVACGGGGGGSTATGGLAATISGMASGTVSASTSQAAGVLTVADPDPGQATFAQPATLTGTYGSWVFTIDGSSGSWRYTLDTARAPAQAVTESLVVRSADGSATQTITVSITASSSSSALVTTVAAPTYSGVYAAEKVAVFNRLNDDRARCGFGKLAQNSKLDLAAQNHANYISNTKDYAHTENPGSLGYTGQTPDLRLGYVGYSYASGGEVIASSDWGTWVSSPDYSTVELPSSNQLLNLFATVYHLRGLMSQAREIGFGVSNFAWNNDSTWNGKITVANYAVPGGGVGQNIPTDAVATFPCNGVSGLIPAFKSEIPDPFPSGSNRDLNPYGQPVYITTGPGSTVTLTSGTITKRGGAAVPTSTLTASSDPHGRLSSNDVFLVPTVRLADNSTYDVALSGTSTGMVSASNPSGAWTRSFSFSTGTMLSE